MLPIASRRNPLLRPWFDVVGAAGRAGRLEVEPDFAVIDFDDSRVRVAPLRFDQRCALVGAEVHHRIGPPKFSAMLGEGR